MYNNKVTFDWDPKKDLINQRKHGVSFTEAQYAFKDASRVITIDQKHSQEHETRYFCFGKCNDRILTVRFTYRDNQIRLFGAGYWREGKKLYEKTNHLS